MSNEPNFPLSKLMNESSVIEYITQTFADVYVMESNGNRFFYSGEFDLKTNAFPFATLVVSDEYDQFSNLSRPGVFRLNIGVSKATFQTMFGSKDEERDNNEPDFTALDTLMPHPVYGKMYWLCVLNPSPATFETLKPLLDEAYEIFTRRRTQKSSD